MFLLCLLHSVFDVVKSGILLWIRRHLSFLHFEMMGERMWFLQWVGFGSRIWHFSLWKLRFR
ncbi:hypothetical protein KC19_12G099400 [Ceratodon purpureus]|uniref:Uncharacterized protein n=1 Tax=Ceratodon purpureus TaxID=3225 RepID=A0A8T0G669_CERPU|nr:hypothetical protein KC19_12G099400 [Ceratodon purpureus]